MKAHAVEVEPSSQPPASHQRPAGHRVQVLMVVWCKLGSGESFFARAADIGLGGIFIESDKRPWLGSKIEVRAILPGQVLELTFRGLVRWQRAGGFGVQFCSLGAQQTHFLTCFLRSDRSAAGMQWSSGREEPPVWSAQGVPPASAQIQISRREAQGP